MPVEEELIQIKPSTPTMVEEIQILHEGTCIPQNTDRSECLREEV